jgi:HlyD family secretion protein
MEFIGMKKNRVALYLLGLLLLLSLTACGATDAATQPEIKSLPLEVSVNPQYIIAEGIVLPAKSASLSLINGGVVDEILAEEGDTVKKGDVIAVLSGSEQLNAAVAAAEYAVTQAQQNLDNFLEEDALNRANLELAYSQAKVALEDAQDKMNNKEFEPASELTLNGLRADYVQALDYLNDAEEEFSGYEHRDETDPVRAQAVYALVEARRAYEKAANNLNTALGYPDADALEKVQSELALAQANFDKAQKDYEAVQEGPDPDQLELLQASLNAAEAQLASAQSDLEDNMLIAPFDGTLVSLNLNEGEYIAPANAIAQIGSLGDWIIESTDVTELDIVSIAVGDPVTIKFDALPGEELVGTVDKIKMLGQEQNGNVIYTVKVKPEEMLPGLRWNMTAFMMFEREK